MGPGVEGFATRRGRHFLGTRLFPESTFLLVYILLAGGGQMYRNRVYLHTELSKQLSSKELHRKRVS